MKPPPFAYLRPATVADAITALTESTRPARVLAGGQSLVQELSARTTSAHTVVDVGQVPGLDYVVVDADRVRVGALCRIAAIEHDPQLAAVLPALVEAAARIAHPAVRNRGTIGGNVVHADPASGIPPVLLAHDGDVLLTGPSGQRTVPAIDFFTGYRSTATGPDELVTELQFARPGLRSGSAFTEISQLARGWGLAGACAVLGLDETGAITRLRLGLLGLAPTAVRADAIETAAVGRAPDTTTIAELADAAVDGLGDIPHDVNASAVLRRSLGRVCVRRVLTHAAERAAGI